MKTVLVASILLAVIFFSVRYAVAHEAIRSLDLHREYERINQRSFDGTLPDVSIGWTKLPDEFGETVSDDDAIRILIDPEQNTTAEELERTISHEACHVAVGNKDYGPEFQDCMKRFD